MPEVPGAEVKRDRVSDFLLVLIGVVIGAMIAVPVAVPVLERRLEWQYRTLACWPTKDDPNPVRH
jgi:hypothetical protein